jgi:hypothetical protein
MKFVLIGLIVVVGIVTLIITVGLSPLSQNLSEAANTSAADVLGSNYSQFDGVPQLLAYWWTLPVFVMAALIGYGVYKVYKK